MTKKLAGLAWNIRFFRRYCGFTQKDFEEYLGVPSGTISRLERTGRVTVSTVIAIEDKTKMAFSYIRELSTPEDLKRLARYSEEQRGEWWSERVKKVH